MGTREALIPWRDAAPRRARTMDELTMVRRAMGTEESLRAGIAFRSRPTDVIVSPFQKCGTTWLQQIVHGLRTSGDLDFDDISRVVPWLETALDSGIDLDAPQVAEPRAFKSHLPWDLVPKPGRYVVAVRQPGDALVSLFRFFEGWLVEPGAVDLDTFAHDGYIANGDYWEHLASWLRHRDDPDVLVLAYEEMKRDLGPAVRRIAAFIGVGDDPERLEIATRQATLESTTRYRDKYDERLTREYCERACHLPPGGETAKVRHGRTGARAELSDATRADLAEQWRRTIGAEFGLADYEALVDELRAVHEG